MSTFAFSAPQPAARRVAKRPTTTAIVFAAIGVAVIALVWLPTLLFAMWALAEGSILGFLVVCAMGFVLASIFALPFTSTAAIIEWVSRRRTRGLRYSWVFWVTCPLVIVGCAGILNSLVGLALMPDEPPSWALAGNAAFTR